MIRPPYLQKGDTVAIVSPAKKINRKEIQFAIDFLEGFGLNVTIGKNTLNSWNRFSGSDNERLEDIQWALNSDQIKAVFCSRGGYGSVRIIDNINFEAFSSKPKWIIGYSDITVFLNHLNSNCDTMSIHGPMPLNIINNPEEIKSANELIETLFGKKLNTRFDFNKLNRIGKGTGRLLGGNLSVLCGLIGTNSDINTNGAILFLEDLCEEHYKLDRMFHQLQKSHKLDNLNGLVVGAFTEMTDFSNWFDIDSYKLIADHLANYEYPVAFGFPAGHTSTNTPIVLGAQYSLEVTNEFSMLKPM